MSPDDSSSAVAAGAADDAAIEAEAGMSVQGVLYCRRSRTASSLSASLNMWKTRFVFLSLHDGGSITVYKTSAVSTNKLAASSATSALVSSVYSSIHRSISASSIRPRLVTDDSSTVASLADRARGNSTAAATTPRTRNGSSSSGAVDIPADPCQQIEMYVPSTLPWIVKDMENDAASFVVEISDMEDLEHDNDEEEEEEHNGAAPRGGNGIAAAGTATASSSSSASAVEFHRTASLLTNQASKASLFDDPTENIREEEEGDDDDVDEDVDDDDVTGDDDDQDDAYERRNGRARGRSSRRRLLRESYASSSKRRQPPVDESERSASQDELRLSISQARRRGKPFRIYFCCKKGRHEKSLWLEAFSRLGRLSTQVQHKKSLLGSLFTSPFAVQSRRRATVSYALARDVRQLELHDDHVSEASPVSTALSRYNNRRNPANVDILVRGRDSSHNKDKEYRVHPTYAYPHRWMTVKEMSDEMILPSETYHTLRHPNCTKREVGSLKVEVLQCLGLPKLDRTSMTDAIVYLVCGEYAFATDVIPNRANPMWLRKSRRACTFPIFHAFARLYVGVFDDDRKRVKDEFAGRVVIDLARLRPRSTYDVTLPLRLSTHVYSRRRRGAIRLRFSLTWHTERDALLSYIPSRIRIPLPQNSRPNLDVVVLCSDQKAFRNIAITVHGTNLPGKFTFQQMRGTFHH
jgi:C2 domain